ncbi:MAG TPA: hypothetical protein VMG82_09885 [Candidatus Sulfotelmatobacter sp.]|nr:hypothetical protein [Candidatus Sulfotelmatobacter sp.]
MAPFEPKTDSKEFEIANLEPGSIGEAADLTIRIWRQNASSRTAELTWSSESVLVYMIADLVAASHGRIAIETPTVMSAHFDTSLQALVAAKRIQTAILEFVTCRPGDYTGAAILVHPATGFSQGTAESALGLTQPGQIILSQEVAKRLKELPRIELRAVPALTTGGAEHVGLAELVWTSAERLATFRDSVPPTANIALPFGATMIVDEPLAGPQSDVASASRKPLAHSAMKGIAHEWRARDGSFEEGLTEFGEQHSFLTRSRMIVGGVLLVLLVAGLMLFHPWSGSSVKPKSTSHEPPTDATAPLTEPANSVPQPPIVAPPPQDVPTNSQPAAAKPPVINSPSPDKTAKDKGKRRQEGMPIQGFEGNSTYDGMTQRDIPRLLQWARSDAGNGNYLKAAQEYRVILQLQPNNSEAREGLRKIQVAQGRDP